MKNVKENNIFDFLKNNGISHAVVCANSFVRGVSEIFGEDWCVIIHGKDEPRIKSSGIPASTRSFYQRSDRRVLERDLTDEEIRFFKRQRDTNFILALSNNDGLVYERKDAPFKSPKV